MFFRLCLAVPSRKQASAQPYFSILAGRLVGPTAFPGRAGDHNCCTLTTQRCYNAYFILHQTTHKQTRTCACRAPSERSRSPPTAKIRSNARKRASPPLPLFSRKPRYEFFSDIPPRDDTARLPHRTHPSVHKKNATALDYLYPAGVLLYDCVRVSSPCVFRLFLTFMVQSQSSTVASRMGAIEATPAGKRVSQSEERVGVWGSAISDCRY